ncbi:PrsW family intramembrane metalloprotease [Candidatus Parcubacteria bacterium]|nr:PrsW family intramembrane metalloprotease [Candidatus Parcubacteria bacterium]
MASPLIFFAFLGGVVPALLWLVFWLLEDRCEPEPKRYIFFAFVLGMLAVFPVLFSERFTAAYASGPILLLVWALIEEVFKFGAAYVAALHWHVFDEPLDAVIYMVTAALGFSAMENTLFLMGPLQHGDIIKTIVTGDLRFIGATLLHTLSSTTIGMALALSFYKPAAVRKTYALIGVILATLLHTFFNFFILQEGGGATFWIFLTIWLGVIGILLFTERIKQPARDYC